MATAVSFSQFEGITH